MAPPRGAAVEIETVSEEQAQKHVRETYAKPDAALKFFRGYMAQREKALKEFDAEVNKDEALAARFARRRRNRATASWKRFCTPATPGRSADARSRKGGRMRRPPCAICYQLQTSRMTQRQCSTSTGQQKRKPRKLTHLHSQTHVQSIRHTQWQNGNGPR